MTLNSGLARRILLAAILGVVALLAVVSPRVGYATPNEQAEPDSFDILIHALRYAEEKRTYIPDDSPIVPINRSLTEWFINEVVNPNIPTSHGHFRDKAELLGKIEYYHPNNAILETLAYLRKYDLLSVALAETLAGLYIESIAEYTDDTPETVRELLTSRVSMAMSDRAALVALYNATDGDNWDDNTNWLSDLPLNYWHRIRVYGGTSHSSGT